MDSYLRKEEIGSFMKFHLKNWETHAKVMVFIIEPAAKQMATEPQPPVHYANPRILSLLAEFRKNYAALT